MKQAIFTFLFVFLPILASADPVEIDGIYYNLENEAKTAEVTKMPSGYYSGDIVIPEKVTYDGVEYIVTCIGYRAFFHCSDMTSVALPNSVTIILNQAFYGCQGITSITIPNNVERIEQSTFNGCTNLNSVSLPGNLLYIGSESFRNCKSLISIDIPSSTTTIDIGAFENCYSLNSITIPKNVSNISFSAFLGCHSLSSIKVESDNPYYDSRDDCNAIIETSSNILMVGCMNTIIPNSVTTIELGAFSDCINLTSITIPSSVTTIGYSAFSNTGLTSITIPSSVMTIGLYAFSGCSNLTSIVVESENHRYDSRNDCNAIIETSSNKLITGCINTIIPNSVTTIGDDAFAVCSNLSSITIPNSVTTIEAFAFRYCSSLTSIVIPNSVISIGEGAFFYCSNLNSVYISENVGYIGKDAFLGCPQINSFIVEQGNQHYDSRNNCNAIIETSSNKLIYGCMNTNIPNTVNTIGFYSFTECINLKSLTIPSSVTTIEEFAFGSCKNLSDVYCYAELPPSTDVSFADIELSQSTLHVPAASINLYRNAIEWEDFGNIVALTDDDPKPTAINSLKEYSPTYPVGIYSIDGKRLQKEQRGLNIIRMNDGKTIKKIVK